MCLRAAWDLVALQTVSLIIQGEGNNDLTAIYIGRETTVTGPKHDKQLNMDCFSFPATNQRGKPRKQREDL